MAIVYQHRRKDTNQVFYIGIGKTKHRAYSKSGRNKHWHNIVNKVGYEVDILIDGCKMSEAKKIEINLISEIGQFCFKSGPLVNITKGGDDNKTNKNRICISKGDREAFIFKHQLEDYVNNGWIKGRSNKTKLAIGKSNSISQLGKKHSDIVKQKMMGPRDPYKVDSIIKKQIISLYKNNKTIYEICGILSISYPMILKTLKDADVHENKRKVKICPHCKVSGGGPNMTRYHFNNCKNKPL
jgi:hypothetical protein